MNLSLDHFFIPSVDKGMTTGQKIMLVLHGRGDSLHSYKTLTKEINVTGLNYLLLNAPFTEYFGFTWYDDSYDFEDHKYVESLKRLKAVFEHLEQQGYSSKDIFLFGFSQGGRMVLDLFLSLGKPLAGVIALSPRVSQFQSLPLKNHESEEVKKTPFLVCHGEFDPVIPIKETEMALKSFQKVLKNFTYLPFSMEHEIDIMELIKVREWLNERL